MNLKKLKEELLKVDEIQILELLDLTTYDIIERFEDRILLRRMYLTKEVMLDNLQEKIEELNFD